MWPIAMSSAKTVIFSPPPQHSTPKGILHPFLCLMPISPPYHFCHFHLSCEFFLPNFPLQVLPSLILRSAFAPSPFQVRCKSVPQNRRKMGLTRESHRNYLGLAVKAKQNQPQKKEFSHYSSTRHPQCCKVLYANELQR